MIGPFGRTSPWTSTLDAQAAAARVVPLLKRATLAATSSSRELFLRRWVLVPL
jgi:hypothetical protein